MSALAHFPTCNRFSGRSRARERWPRCNVDCRLRRTFLSGVVLLLAVWPAVASADSITLNNDGRFVSLLINPDVLVRQRAADVLTATGSSSSSVSGAATLISSIDDLHHLTGSGVASLESAGSAQGFAEASTGFVVGFTIDVPHDYSFRGSWTGSGDKGGTAILSLVHPLSVDRFFNHLVNAPGVFESSRRLPSGTYTFEVTSNVTGNSFSPTTTRLNSSFDFSFDLQAAPTPEPASIFLFGSGLFALATRVHRRRRPHTTPLSPAR